MAKRINILSAKKIPTLTEKGLYADGGNLYLQVTASGSKSWIFRYMFDGSSRYMGLGALHTVSLALARQKAEEARKLILDVSTLSKIAITQHVPSALKKQKILHSGNVLISIYKIMRGHGKTPSIASNGAAH